MIYQIYSYSKEFLEKKPKTLPFIVVYSISEAEIKKSIKILQRVDPGIKFTGSVFFHKPNLRSLQLESDLVSWHPCTSEDAIQWYKE